MTEEPSRRRWTSLEYLRESVDRKQLVTGVLVGLIFVVILGVYGLAQAGVIDIFGGSDDEATAVPPREWSPPHGSVPIAAEASREFFNRELLVTIGPIRRTESGFSVDRLVLRGPDIEDRCVHAPASVGQGLAMISSHAFYGVVIRSLSPTAARVIALRSERSGGDGGCPLFYPKVPIRLP